MMPRITKCVKLYQELLHVLNKSDVPDDEQIGVVEELLHDMRCG